MKQQLTYLEQIFQKIKHWSNRNRCLVFLVTIVVAFTAHLWLFTNQIPNADTVVYTAYQASYTWELSLGRWFIPVLGAFKANMVLSSVIMVITLFLLGLTAVLLVELFELKKRSSQLLTGAMTAVFPTVCAVMVYYYCADIYIVAQFLAVLAVYLSRFHKWQHDLLAIGALTICLGTYQSYYCMAIALYFCLILKELILIKIDYKVLFRHMARYLLIGVSSMALYFIIREISLQVYQLSLASYMGMNDLHFSLSMLPDLLYNCYYQFARFFFGTTFFYNPLSRKITYAILWGCLAVSITTLVRTRKLYKQKGTFCLMVIFLSILPVIFMITIFMVMGTDTLKLRMFPQLLLVFIFIIAIVEHKTYHNRLIKDIVFVASMFLVYQYFIVTTQTYLNLQLNFNKAQAITIRVIDRLETHPDYQPTRKIAIVGGLRNSTYPVANHDVSAAVVGINSSELEILYDNNANSWRNMIKQYGGANMNIVTQPELNQIMLKEEVKAMPTFPDREAVQLVDEVLVVKLGT